MLLRISTFLLITILFCSCAALKPKTKSSIGLAQAGMTKTEVITLIGTPYKQSFFHDENKVLHEELFYKESLYLEGWYEINSILHFENARLISVEQGRERPLRTEEKVIIEKSEN